MLGKLLGAVTGDAGQVAPEALGERFLQALLPDETVLAAFRTVRDGFALTDWRLLIMDRQGVTGSKTAVVSVPYRSVLRFSVETGGTLDLDEELRIWDRAGADPWSFSLRRGGGAAALAQRILSERLRG
ncbi:PH domain-containing protein [Roseomonas sp. GCM10028921]|uniref:Bacterial Pleckstrin homology domain-containing protein n=1 Tax=Muricoccus pecuniae TaxID=693023 RepID=A0A840XWY6_9PROT|nr:PH domain-containing protein [Roseomonas pecuniae]MBB5692396.1 hypothetical protein [Roseomonas pecuniae]